MADPLPLTPEGALRHRDIPNNVPPGATVLVPGHIPVTFEDVLARDEIALIPDIYVKVNLNGYTVKDMEVGPRFALPTAFSQGIVGDQWIVLLSTEAPDVDIRHTEAPEMLATAYLSDGGALSIFPRIAPGLRGTWGIPGAPGSVPLRVQINYDGHDRGPLTLVLSPDFAEIQNNRHELPWGFLYLHSVVSREISLTADEDSTSLPVQLGSKVGLKIRSENTSLYGGTELFVHDGSPRVVFAYRAMTIAGRALGEAALPIQQEVNVRWKEIGRDVKEGDKGQRRGECSFRPDDHGAFAIHIAPSVDLAQPLDDLEIEIEPTSYQPVIVTITNTETHIGDITFEPSSRIQLLINPRRVPSLIDAWKLQERKVEVHFPVSGRKRRTYNASRYGINNDGILWLTLTANEVAAEDLNSSVASVTMVGTNTDNDRSFFLRRTGDRAYVAVPRERQYTVIFNGFSEDAEQDVSLEWWWPSPESGFGGSIALSEVANGKPLRFLPMPEGDLWICWRIGEGKEEGRIRLSQPETTITIR